MGRRNAQFLLCLNPGSHGDLLLMLCPGTFSSWMITTHFGTSSPSTSLSDLQSIRTTYNTNNETHKKNDAWFSHFSLRLQSRYFSLQQVRRRGITASNKNLRNICSGFFFIQRPTYLNTHFFIWFQMTLVIYICIYWKPNNIRSSDKLWLYKIIENPLGF